MEGDAPQVPVAQEVQPEVKEVPQTPQQPPVGSQATSESTTHTKSKKGLKLKILIILMILVGLGIGGFFVWKKVFVPTAVYKGIWPPLLFFEDPNYLASNIPKLKDMGINTVFLVAFPPFTEQGLEKVEEVFGSELMERVKELIPIEEQIVIDNIQTAHRNGLKVALTVGDIPAPESVDIETINSRIGEVARLAEEYDVELFTPLNEPDMPNTGRWRQEILHRIKEVYHGEVSWNGAGVGLPSDKELNDEFFREIAEQPPGDYVGYDYIGFGSQLMPDQTLEEYSEYVEKSIDYMLAQAERDGCKGVIITEFGALIEISLSEEEMARAFEIVLEKGKDKVSGFFVFRINFLEVNVPGVFFKENLKTQEVIKRYFTEIL